MIKSIQVTFEIRDQTTNRAFVQLFPVAYTHSSFRLDREEKNQPHILKYNKRGAKTVANIRCYLYTGSTLVLAGCTCLKSRRRPQWFHVHGSTASYQKQWRILMEKHTSTLIRYHQILFNPSTTFIDSDLKK